MCCQRRGGDVRKSTVWNLLPYLLFLSKYYRRCCQRSKTISIKKNIKKRKIWIEDIWLILVWQQPSNTNNQWTCRGQHTVFTYGQVLVNHKIKRHFALFSLQRFNSVLYGILEKKRSHQLHMHTDHHKVVIN